MIEIKESTQRTAANALVYLQSQPIDENGNVFFVPSSIGFRNLMVAFAEQEMSLPRHGFDIVRCPQNLDLENLEEVRHYLDEIKICEVKSTKKLNVDQDFNGYFFSLSTEELLAAQKLADRHCFVFVNLNEGKQCKKIITLSEVMFRATAIYPVWSISFGNKEKKRSMIKKAA